MDVGKTICRSDELPGLHDLELRSSIGDLAHQQVIIDGEPIKNATQLVLTLDAEAIPVAEITCRYGLKSVGVFGFPCKLRVTRQDAEALLQYLQSQSRNSLQSQTL